MRKLIVVLALLLTYTNSYTQDREQMRQMVSEFMKKIGIEDDQIQNSMMLVRKVMMEYVNEMEISEESIKKLENYNDKQRQALKDIAKKLIKVRSEKRSKSNPYGSLLLNLVRSHRIWKASGMPTGIQNPPQNPKFPRKLGCPDQWQVLPGYRCLGEDCIPTNSPLSPPGAQ